MPVKKLIVRWWYIWVLCFGACGDLPNQEMTHHESPDALDSLEMQEIRQKWKKSLYQSPDSIKAVAEEMLRFATKTKSNLARVSGNNMLSGYYSRIGEHEKAIGILNENLEINGDDPEGLAQIYNNLGNIYTRTGDFDKALEAQLSGLKAEEVRENLEGTSISLLNIAGVYAHLKELDKTLIFAKKSFLIGHTNSFLPVKMQSAFQIAEVYLGFQKDSLALIYADSVMSVATLLNTEFGKNKARTIQSKALANQDRLKEALSIIRASKIYYESKNNTSEFILQCIEEVSTLNKLAKWTEAESVAEKTLPIALQRDQKEEVWNLYGLLAQAQEQQGKLQVSYDNYKNYKRYQDSVVNIDKNEVIEELAVKYETEKKEAEITTLTQQGAIQSLEIKQKNQTIIIGAIVFLFAIAVIFFFYQQRNASRKQSQTELEHRFLRSQLNPHFISNALVAVQSFMLKNAPESAALYLTKFSKLMREILENSRKEFISVDAEISMLRNYLDIHKMRLSDSFEYSIIIHESISSDEDTIPPMFVQPFLENAVEHGIGQIKGGQISLRFEKDGDYIAIAISDNGVGLTQNKLVDHNSLSSTIIEERMALFNRSLKRKIQLVVENMKSEKGEIIGTNVELKVPFGYI